MPQTLRTVGARGLVTPSKYQLQYEMATPINTRILSEMLLSVIVAAVPSI